MKNGYEELGKKFGKNRKEHLTGRKELVKITPMKTDRTSVSLPGELIAFARRRVADEKRKGRQTTVSGYIGALVAADMAGRVSFEAPFASRNGNGAGPTRRS